MSEPNLDELNESIKLLINYRNRLEKEVSSIARKLQMPPARINSTLKENPELHSGTPTLGYVIAILKEIEALSRAKIPNRKILVVLAGQEQITDNVAVMQLTNRYDFINVETIEKAQHEILIEKNDIRVEGLSLMHKFLKS